MPRTPFALRLALILALLMGPLLAAPGVTHAATIVVRPVATGLAYPVGFAFAPDGRIFYIERSTGTIRIFDPDHGTSTVFATVPGAASMIGLALHPSYPTQPFVYVYGTRKVGGVRLDQLLRFRDNAGKGQAMSVLLSRDAAPPGPTAHHGGRLLFGAHGALFLMIGDESDPAHAQDPSELAGKMLRMKPNGSPAANNPVPGSRVFASGLRNSIGYDLDPSTARLWLVDNGPECNDEVDQINAGSNYGWGPSETCSTPPAAPRNTNQDGPSPVLPKYFFPATVGVTGLTFCTGCGLGSGAEGKLLFGDYNSGAIHAATLNAARTGVVSQTVIVTHAPAVLDMEVDPGGVVYFSDPTGIYRLATG
jgi:glucose/arabinose dehydrogenase